MGQTDDSQTPLDRVLRPADRGLPRLFRNSHGRALRSRYGRTLESVCCASGLLAYA